MTFVLGATIAAAQSATGSIEGTVADPSGAPTPGVTVTLTHQATGVTRDVVTDGQGLFRAPLLPVGGYEVRAELSGFGPFRQRDVALTVGQTLTLTVPLAPAALSETVNVSGQTPLVEATRSQVSSTVGEASVANLPVNGRNFIDFALLTPGLTKDVRTGDISFAGQRGTLNSLVVDGADNNNTFFGQSLGRTATRTSPATTSRAAARRTRSSTPVRRRS